MEMKRALITRFTNERNSEHEEFRMEIEAGLGETEQTGNGESTKSGDKLMKMGQRRFQEKVTSSKLT